MKLPRRLRQPVYFFAGALAVAAVYFTIVIGNRILSNPSGAPSRVPHIPVEAFTLANGLHVLVHRDATAPGVAMKCGTTSDQKMNHPVRRGWRISLSIAFQPKRAHRQRVGGRFPKLGAWDYNALTNRDRTRFLMTVPKAALSAALWLESERMAGIANRLTEKLLDEARQTLLNEIRRSESDGERCDRNGFSESSVSE